MSPHTCIILLLKLAKRNKKEEEGDKKVDELHMNIKCPKQPGHFLGKEDCQYASRPEKKFHPKNVWQSLENPLAH